MTRNELTLLSDFDRVFDRPFFDTPFRWPAFHSLIRTDGSKWIPEIDVFERKNMLVTKIDLPGMKKEDVKVEVADGHLRISGERKYEMEESKENIYRAERSYGSFYRAVPLPKGVTLEEVKASFENGVLEVTMPIPREPEVKARHVPIQASAPAKEAVGAGA